MARTALATQSERKNLEAHVDLCAERYDRLEQRLQALELAISTWGDIVPVVHYSESRNIEQENDKIRPQAHSDYVYDYIDTYGNKVDIMVEAKAKELAVLKYKEIHNDTTTNS